MFMFFYYNAGDYIRYGYYNIVYILTRFNDVVLLK